MDGSQAALSPYSLDLDSCCCWLGRYSFHSDTRICLWILVRLVLPSFLQCLSSTCYLPGSVPGTGDVINKAGKVAVLKALILRWKRRAQKKAKKKKKKNPPQNQMGTNSWRKSTRMTGKAVLEATDIEWRRKAFPYILYKWWDDTRWFKSSSSQNNMRFTLAYQSLNFHTCVLT